MKALAFALAMLSSSSSVAVAVQETAALFKRSTAASVAQHLGLVSIVYSNAT